MWYACAKNLAKVSSSRNFPFAMAILYCPSRNLAQTEENFFCIARLLKHLFLLPYLSAVQHAAACCCLLPFSPSCTHCTHIFFLRFLHLFSHFMNIKNKLFGSHSLQHQPIPVAVTSNSLLQPKP